MYILLLMSLLGNAINCDEDKDEKLVTVMLQIQLLAVTEKLDCVISGSPVLGAPVQFFLTGV